MEKKRLLKDLPFNLQKDEVLTKGNGGYYIDKGSTIYKEGGSSSNGWNVLDAQKIAIIDLIWDNKDWFVDANLKHVDIKTCRDKIIISFDPLDLEQAQTFAKGIRSCLANYGNEEGRHTWDEFKGFTGTLS